MTRRGLLTVAAGIPLLASDDESDWRDFVAWFKKQPPGSGNVWQLYRAKLKKDGLSDSQVNSIIDALTRRAQTSNELSSLLFDRIYSSSTPAFRTEPNGFLVDCVAGVKPGRALDIDMGQGRNSLYLAGKGWDVTGIDIAEEGLAQARAAASKAGLKLHTVKESHERFDYGRAQWDLVAMIYTWVPVSERPLVQRIMDSLRPNGLLVFEHFLSVPGAPPPAPAAQRNPGEVAPNQLLTVFSSLRILHYEDRLSPSDWAPGQSRVARLLATRSA